MSRRPRRRDRVTALMLLLRADPCSGLPRRRFLRGGLFRGWLRQPLGLRPLRARRLRRTRSGADGMFEFFERFDRVNRQPRQRWQRVGASGEGERGTTVIAEDWDG